VVVSTYNFWGCKDTKVGLDKEKKLDKIQFFVEKSPKIALYGLKN